MAETKKTTVAKPAKAAKAAEVKKEEASKAETKKPAVKKTAAKKTVTKKAAVDKTMEVKDVKAESTAVVHLQFSGKSYTTEDLVKSAKDVWQYDLNRKPEDFKTVALYVKPEENLVYYVVNDEVSGNFFI